jgi:hypothetical protein
MSKFAIGIDLGTTYSCIAAFIDGKVVVLTDSDGNRTMPSVVAFIEDGEPEVGETAQKNVDVDIGNRVYGKESDHSNFVMALKKPPNFDATVIFFCHFLIPHHKTTHKNIQYAKKNIGPNNFWNNFLIHLSK